MPSRDIHHNDHESTAISKLASAKCSRCPDATSNRTVRRRCAGRSRSARAMASALGSTLTTSRAAPAILRVRRPSPPPTSSTLAPAEAIRPSSRRVSMCSGSLRTPFICPPGLFLLMDELEQDLFCCGQPPVTTADDVESPSTSPILGPDELQPALLQIISHHRT